MTPKKKIIVALAFSYPRHWPRWQWAATSPIAPYATFG